MRSSLSFSILIWAYSKRAKNNRAGLYARITINGKRVNISLKERVNLNVWDSKLQKAKGNSETSRSVNHFIAQVKADIMQCYRDLSNGARVVTGLSRFGTHYNGQMTFNGAYPNLFSTEWLYFEFHPWKLPTKLFIKL